MQTVHVLRMAVAAVTADAIDGADAGDGASSVLRCWTVMVLGEELSLVAVLRAFHVLRQPCRPTPLSSAPFAYRRVSINFNLGSLGSLGSLDLLHVVVLFIKVKVIIEAPAQAAASSSFFSFFSDTVLKP